MLNLITHLGAPPVPLELVVPIALVPSELLRPLLHNLRAGGRGESHPESIRDLDLKQKVLQFVEGDL